MGRVQSARNQPEAAIAAFKEALRLNPVRQARRSPSLDCIWQAAKRTSRWAS
jgi:hypothetical protein